MKPTAHSRSEAQRRSQDGYILVVDDLADNLFLLKAILETEGYTVELANSGSTAIAKAEAVPPDLMLLDVMMPGMTGYEVTQRIRQSEHLAEVPVVLITAYGEENATTGEAVGADGFIRKPIDVEVLLQQVRAYV